MKRLLLLCLLTLAAACQQMPRTEPASPTLAAEGQALARTTCANCHAVEPNRSSSNPNAPPFPYIVNQEGVTAETLTYWLRGAHNYPSDMDFYLSEREADALVAYLLTLRDPNYRRPPD
jgi:mono/diheme cytochrome c family protein